MSIDELSVMYAKECPELGVEEEHKDNKQELN